MMLDDGASPMVALSTGVVNCVLTGCAERRPVIDRVLPMVVDSMKLDDAASIFDVT